MTHRRRKNKYFIHSHISEGVFRRVVMDFSTDVTAETTARRTGLERKTVNRLFLRFRERIECLCEAEELFTGDVEVDESYFGARRVRGKRGRGARGKVPVIGLLKRGGKVYTRIIPNCTKKQLMPIIQGKVLSGSTIHTDGWTSSCCAATSITGSTTTRMSLPEERITLTGLNPSGATRNDDS